jgi:ribosomal protein S18 acetylase RimI-like enzyme
MSGESSFLEIRRLTTDWKQSILVFFRALEETSSADFQPHPFTDEAVERILHNTRRDLYYVMVEGTEVLGYGLLRGWDEGYEIPSLGIAIHPRIRSIGLGRVFMHFLAAAAKCRGAQKVRLRVMSRNTRARRLYESLGYEFGSEEDGGYRVGFLELRSGRSTVSPRRE